MNTKIKQVALLTAYLLLFINFEALSQTTASNDSTKVIPKAIPLSQISDFGKKTRAVVNSAQSLIAKTDEPTSITEKLNQYLQYWMTKY